MEWAASGSTLSGGSWLSLSPNRGVTDAASLNVPLANVTVSAAGLLPESITALSQ